jgi:hypothetical protein
LSAYVTGGLARVVLVSLVLCGSTASARADWLFTPFFGSTFAGSTVLPDLEQSAGGAHLIFGGEAGWWSSGVFGIETDFAFVPAFFERTQGVLVTESNVLTLGMDVVVATPLSVTRESLRPYLIGGLGWMHSSIEERQGLFPELFGRAQNSAAVNVGGGAMGFFTPRTGVRFEVRHFRSLKRDTDVLTGESGSLLSYWRATVGVVIKR